MLIMCSHLSHMPGQLGGGGMMSKEFTSSSISFICGGTHRMDCSEKLGVLLMGKHQQYKHQEDDDRKFLFSSHPITD